jgi:hypothetical protein
VRAAAGVAHHREGGDAQRVGDRGGAVGGRRHVPAGAARRAAVSGPIEGQPADSETLGRVEQRPRRRTDVGGAVVPENGKASIAVGVVGVERVAVS